jgi:hypothetical protein
MVVMRRRTIPRLQWTLVVGVNSYPRYLLWGIGYAALSSNTQQTFSRGCPLEKKSHLHRLSGILHP